MTVWHQPIMYNSQIRVIAIVSKGQRQWETSEFFSAQTCLRALSPVLSICGDSPDCWLVYLQQLLFQPSCVGGSPVTRHDGVSWGRFLPPGCEQEAILRKRFFSFFFWKLPQRTKRAQDSNDSNNLWFILLINQLAFFTHRVLHSRIRKTILREYL